MSEIFQISDLRSKRRISLGSYLTATAKWSLPAACDTSEQFGAVFIAAAPPHSARPTEMEENMAEDGGQNELFDKGLAMRRAVLGAEYVDRSIQNADAFTQPFQKLVTEWCWGEVWDRPGLDKKTRSMLNLAMLTALNGPNEVRLHVRGALNNGVTHDEIQEVLLHTTVYCGVPAALESFRIAVEVLKEEDAQKS
jgi:4-carboxymuconolactone decarboxylase